LRPTRKTDYLAWLIQSTPDTVKRWVDGSELRSEVVSYFDRVWTERVETPEWLAGYARACPIEGAGPELYRLREIDVLSNAAVLAGIHFAALDVARPFVNVFAQTRDFTGPEVTAVTSVLIDAFPPFKPLRVRWWSPEQLELRGLPGATGDHRLVIGRLQEIREGSPARLPDRFSFAPESAAVCYEEYARAYTGFLAASHAMEGRMRTESKETLDECARAGALFILRDGDRLAGLMAARPQTLRGIKGWEIVEEFLWDDYRGRGIAPAMQGRFTSGLDNSHAQLVFGEIHDLNVPSLRTALRAGRTDVGGWVFVRP
jgi:hypothetical protein